MYYSVTDEDTLDKLDLVDDIILYIFLAEVILKIIALGIFPYFSDNWNKYSNIRNISCRFDFTLVMISLGVNLSINAFQMFRSAKGARVAKASKLARVIIIIIIIIIFLDSKIFQGIKRTEICSTRQNFEYKRSHIC